MTAVALERGINQLNSGAEHVPVGVACHGLEKPGQVDYVVRLDYNMRHDCSGAELMDSRADTRTTHYCYIMIDHGSTHISQTGPR